jgi:hypothetical protein
VPQTLVQGVIKVNHDPQYAAYAGIKSTYSFIALSYWWSGMRKSIEDYVKCCDSCQRRKGDRNFQVRNFVYFYNPAIKPGLTKKFQFPWSGPFEITRMISDLNYEVADQNVKRQIVHVNRLKELTISILGRLSQTETP